MEEPSTVADALLDDLDDLSDNESLSEGAEPSVDYEEGVERSSTLDNTFLHDKQLLNHLQAIRESESVALNAESSRKELENDEYRLIVQSNKQLARLADELSRAHGRLCVLYNDKFPELEEIIPN